MGNVTIGEMLSLALAAVVVTATGYEINRRRKELREIYDVLDSRTKHVAAQLEDMIEQGHLQPYTGENWA
jgi:hypothetical protein